MILALVAGALMVGALAWLVGPALVWAWRDSGRVNGCHARRGGPRHSTKTP